MPKECGLTVKLTKKAIEIKLPLSVLPACVEYNTDMQEHGAKVIYLDEFAKEVMTELSREDDTGANMVHRMFDAAFLEAFEQGALGIATDDD